MVVWKTIRNAILGSALACCAASLAMAQGGAAKIAVDESKTPQPAGLEGVGIEQRLNQAVPLDLTFRDEQGKVVRLGDYFHQGKPVILNFVYYNCPMLCTEVLNGLTSTLKVLKFAPGKEFEIVTLSIDPRETPDLAAAKKQMYLRKLGNPAAAAGWHFLVGEESPIKTLADAAGWHYRYDPKFDQFAHAAGILLITPEGRIAQYYYGVEYSAKDLRLGIVEASQNKIGTVADQVLLYCFHYDPRTGRYGAVVTNIVRLGGAITVVVLGSALVFMFRREKHTRQTGRA